MGDIEVKVPEEPRVRFKIDLLATYVVEVGAEFEKIVMNIENKTRAFDFVSATDTTEHVYYLWRLYSLANGDGIEDWRCEPFLMIYGGNRWIPPSTTSFYTQSQHSLTA